MVFPSENDDAIQVSLHAFLSEHQKKTEPPTVIVLDVGGSILTDSKGKGAHVLSALKNIHWSLACGSHIPQLTELRVEVFGPGCSATAFVPIVQGDKVQAFLTSQQSAVQAVHPKPPIRQQVSYTRDPSLAEAFGVGLSQLLLASYSIASCQENHCFLRAMKNKKVFMAQPLSDPCAWLQEYLAQQPGDVRQKALISQVLNGKDQNWCLRFIQEYLLQCLVFFYPPTQPGRR